MTSARRTRRRRNSSLRIRPAPVPHRGEHAHSRHLLRSGCTFRDRHEVGSGPGSEGGGDCRRPQAAILADPYLNRYVPFVTEQVTLVDRDDTPVRFS